MLKLKMQTVFVIEDDRKIGRIIHAYLEGAGFSVKIFEKGKEAIDSAIKQPPDIVILDLMLPDMNGEDLFQELKEIGDFPIIILTAKSSEEERITGFALGADDYVVKPFSPRELVYRVKAVLKRVKKEDLKGVETISFNNGYLKIDGQSYSVEKGGIKVNLTPTEFKILFTLASSPNKVFTRDELVVRALGYEFEGYERSIDAHIKNIRHKLEDNPRRPDYIVTVYGVGYKFGAKKDL